MKQTTQPAAATAMKIMGLGGIHVAEAEEVFRALVHDLFASLLGGTRRPEEVARYTWEATLADLAPAYARLAARFD